MTEAILPEPLPREVIDRRNKRTAIFAFTVVAGMVGLAYASVPLYDLFCRVTGFGGTTQVATEAASNVLTDHPVKVRFDSNVNPALKWDFRPISEPVTMAPGETIIVQYRATNLSDETTTGTATFNVTPQKAGPYFMKIECFCFTEQALAPGESIDMPVSFFIDPEIASDANTQDVDEIVLSYTFFPLAGS